jgi:hypothetical protein
MEHGDPYHAGVKSGFRRLNRDWQPYSVGHWVYSDDYGWYWISGDEGQSGLDCVSLWSVVNVDAYGWAWVPGNSRVRHGSIGVAATICRLGSVAS